MTTSTEIPVRTDISPSLHPDATMDVADVMEGVPGPAGAAYAEAREAFATIYEAIGRVNDVEATLLSTVESPRTRESNGGHKVVEKGAFMEKGRLNVRHGREEEFGLASGHVLDRAARDCDGRYSRLVKHAVDLKLRLDTAIADPNAKTSQSIALGAEARGYIRSLGDTAARIGAFWSAAEAGDRVTVSAVLNAPAYLSGFTPDELANLRTSAMERLAPTEYAQWKAAERLADRVRWAGGQLLERRLAVKRAVEREAASPRGQADRALRGLAGAA